MWEEHNVNPQDRKCVKGFCYWWQEKKQHIGLRGKQCFKVIPVPVGILLLV